MPTKTLTTEMDGTPKQIVFANHAGDFSPTAANDLRKTTDDSQELDVEMVMLNWADQAAIQSAKFDFGENWADEYDCFACPEAQVAAFDDGGTIEFYLASSHHATVGTANPGGVAGVAGAYSGYSSDLATAKRQLLPIGVMVVTDHAVPAVQIAFVERFSPGQRYGTLVMVNKTGQIICDTDDIEAHIVFNPVVPESQEA